MTIQRRIAREWLWALGSAVALLVLDAIALVTVGGNIEIMARLFLRNALAVYGLTVAWRLTAWAFRNARQAKT